ncbi:MULTISPECIES: NUDIX hydrolase [Alphaproteobacteria]|jgi:8-oxo-dGTP pyrophosphatase MutT (NUDIX family)|uniref:NUDIX domain-containing protein n=1 Tax=Erythrobacter sanguineus TaxID=198312 RepID=A0A1M7S8F4_9SPHN|nr:NUDIX hydrolase [Erythrobacter sanguineus]SHN54867.1 NUDIX domain-containing protein [Erythrobacter sanguineus]
MTIQQPVDPVPAATMLLLRDTPEFQVLMVKRHHQIDFASGALVFPGGKPSVGDEIVEWADHCRGWGTFDATQRTLRIAAIREAYEEAGILLADHRDGGAFEDTCDLESRKAVERGEREFLDVVREAGVHLRLDQLSIFARWITPTFMPKRFDTHFFVVRAPERQIAACDGYETVDAEWLSPHKALEMEATGERTIIFPTRLNLQLLAKAASAADCVAQAEARDIVTVLPEIIQRDGKNVLTIPADAGYGPAHEIMG